MADRGANTPALLRKFYDAHLRGFEYVSSSLHAQQRLQEQAGSQPSPARDGKGAAIRPEEAATILGSLIGTAGQTPAEYISAVQPKPAESPKVKHPRTSVHLAQGLEQELELTRADELMLS